MGILKSHIEQCHFSSSLTLNADSSTDYDTMAQICLVVYPEWRLLFLRMTPNAGFLLQSRKHLPVLSTRRLLIAGKQLLYRSMAKVEFLIVWV